MAATLIVLSAQLITVWSAAQATTAWTATGSAPFWAADEDTRP